MPGNSSISGLALLGNELFVVRCKSEVAVYNSKSFKFLRNIKIPDSNTLYGVVSCRHYNCLYIADPIKMILHKYSVFKNVSSHWSLGGECYGLSVTSSYNVLATLHSAKLIKEFDTNGDLIREIFLDARIQIPKHCIELSDGTFVVCHEGATLHRVCIVDTGGCIIESFGGAPGSGIQQLKGPRYLAVDKDDNVLVTDYYNDRVRVLSPTLALLGDVPILRHELSGPLVLHFDEQMNRLYIGEQYGERLFVLKTYINNDNKEI